MLNFLEEKVLLDVRKQVLEVVREIVSEEFLKKERFHLREDVDAALLAIKGLELSIVTGLVTLFLHHE
jgi:hypothetical protein